MKLTERKCVNPKYKISSRSTLDCAVSVKIWVNGSFSEIKDTLPFTLEYKTFFDPIAAYYEFKTKIFQNHPTTYRQHSQYTYLLSTILSQDT